MNDKIANIDAHIIDDIRTIITKATDIQLKNGKKMEIM